MREGEIPVPIPNTTVKTFAADGTMLETAWESRRLPGLFYKRIRFRSDEGREQKFQYLENRITKQHEDINKNRKNLIDDQTSKNQSNGDARRKPSVNTEGSQRYGDPSGEPKIEDQKVKQERAQGGCPGTGSRRKT